MAGSRLDRIGTIFSRATGLIKAGAVKYEDRPLWYDIYRVFPPKYEPFISRQPEKKEVIDMLYKEDKFRAMYFKQFGMNPGGIARKLNDRNFEEPSQPFINVCMDLLKARPEWDDNQIFQAAVESHRSHLASLRAEAPSQNQNERDVADEMEAMKRHGRKPPTLTVQSLRSLFEEAQEQQKRRESLLEEQDSEEEKKEKEQKT